jgi:Reverse transcriptase (RNA-dependent DNA polymerase)
MANQINDIPKDVVISLENLPDRLKGSANYTSWNIYVKKTLNIEGLGNLIDSTVPRPTLQDPNFLLWKKTSLKIGMWLVKQLNTDLVEKLDLSPTPTDYADETYDAIKRMVIGSGIEDIGNAYLLATSIQREDYGSMEHFVHAFRQAVKQANRTEGTQIPPLAAALLLLRAIQKELPMWVTTVKHDIGKRQNPGRMTEMELLDLCEKAIDQGREQERSYVSKSNLKGSNTIRPTPISNTTNSTPKRNMPPKGTKAFKWVEQWLQGNPRNSQNKCSFCETGLHDCKDCWYLVPEKRPLGWTPYDGLWCYKAFNRNQPSPSQFSQARNTSPLSAPRSETSEPQNQSKMTVEFTRDEEPYDMQIIPGFMSMASLPKTEPTSNPNAHFDPKDIDPGDFPTYRPWLSDTATNYFICSERTAIFEYQNYGPSGGPQYETSNGEIASAKGHGKCFVQLQSDNGSTYDLIVECLYNPNISCNVFASHVCMKTHGLWVCGKDGTVRKTNTDDVVGHTYNVNGLPYLRVAKPQRSFAATQALLEHRRLAHCGHPKFKATAKSNGITLTDLDFHCEPCHIAKAKRQVSHTTLPRSKNVWDLIHIDVQPVKPVGHGGVKYYLIIVNDKHRIPEVDFLHSKDEASDKMIAYCKAFKNLTGHYPVRVRLDGGSEFAKFTTWAKSKKGIQIELTPPRTPEPNGVAERYAGYLNQTARAMIIDAGLPEFLWPHAIETAAYTINRITSPNETESPLQKFRKDLGHDNSKSSTSIKHLQIWGTRCYKHIPKEDRVQARKAAPRAFIGYLVGYEGDNGHIYKVWLPNERKVVRSRDVTFSKGDVSDDDSDDPIQHPMPPKPNQPNSGFNTTTIDLRIPKQVSQQTIQEAPYTTGRLQTLSETPTADRPIQTIETIEDQPQYEQQTDLQPAASVVNTMRASSRSTKGVPPARLIDELKKESSGPKKPTGGVMFAVSPLYGSYKSNSNGLKAHDIVLPKTYKEAISSNQKEHWIAAMDDQIAKLEKKGTYKLVDPPKTDPNTKILPGKWVYVVKTDADNSITEWRARWVVCGNHQRIGFDFDNTYAPVVTESATKLVLTTIAIHNLYAEQIDFITAYLNAQLEDRKLYMRRPTGYYGNRNDVCLLSQALYGLRQSAFLWNRTIDKKLRDMGFTPLFEDPCVYIRKSGNTFAIIYVDDAIIAATSKEEVDQIKKELNTEFPLKDLGEPDKFLGCHLIRDYENSTIILSQAPICR